MSTFAAHVSGVGPMGQLDRLLRFDADTEARYEREQTAHRVASIRAASFIGLLVFQASNLTCFLLTPDVFLPSIALRVLVIIPASLFIIWRIGRCSALEREFHAFSGILGAFLVMLTFFWLSKAPLAAYTFSEVTSALVFGNMLLPLRFRHALAFSAIFVMVALAALATKAGLDVGLRVALGIQGWVFCLFTLYANYRHEKRRCSDYLVALNARLRSEAAEGAEQQFRDLSRTDALTGLPNRRYLDETIEKEMAADSDGGVAVLMIDIDHFKLFNDTLGHPAGDDCLRLVARAMRNAVERPDDLVARFGGEEFTCVARATTPFEAAKLARHLIDAVSALAILHPGRCDGLGIVTISIGVALKSSGESRRPADVLAEADAALYQAKRRGRHCFAFAGGSSGTIARA